MPILFGFIIVFVLSSHVSAAHLNDDDINQKDSSPSKLRTELNQEPFERIGIEGRIPLAFYKRQFEIAELDFYDMFNALNEVPDFTMYCRKRAETGTNIKKTYCYPQYMLKRYASETQNAIANTPRRLLAVGAVRNLPTYQQIEGMVEREQEKALEYAEQLVQDNPDLLKQLLKMKEAELLYLQKKQQLKEAN